LKDYLSEALTGETLVGSEVFAGKTARQGGHGSVEWAVAWFAGDGFTRSYCNTIPTSEGGTHEAGLRSVLLRGVKAYADLVGNKRAAVITSDDIMTSCGAMLSVFVREPEFVGQTKDRLASSEAIRIVDNAMRDAFDHWLAASPVPATQLLDWDDRPRRRALRRRRREGDFRKTATRKLRLPGKARRLQRRDHARTPRSSSSKAIRPAARPSRRATAALRRSCRSAGKILNVANRRREKVDANSSSATCSGARLQHGRHAIAKGGSPLWPRDHHDGRRCGRRPHRSPAHHLFSIASWPELIRQWHLYLAVPPLFRSRKAKVLYARRRCARDMLMRTRSSLRARGQCSRPAASRALGEKPIAPVARPPPGTRQAAWCCGVDRRGGRPHPLRALP
jgi:topoisomerase-4 subunit B